MTTSPERFHAVWLHDRYVGTLHQRDDFTRFVLSPRYLNDPGRPVLGLDFEQNLRARHVANLRLPQWFSNLLPEGRLREWVALDRGVSTHREMELLLQVGHDLPGAVRVVEDSGDPTDDPPDDVVYTAPIRENEKDSRLRFSLAGVALKFSMLAAGERLAMPASGAGGDWIVKLPDRRYSHVPENEFAMMRLARIAGADVPDTLLVHRDSIDGIDQSIWHPTEDFAYAVRRFDRSPGGGAVHIEDLAQARGLYPDHKYHGNYETVAAYVYRRSDIDSLREFVRRLVISILISNGDAHLKNWSLIYPDRRIARLAPAYDLVSTQPYMGESEELALKLAGSKRFDVMGPRTFSRLEAKLGADAGLADLANDTAQCVRSAWSDVEESLAVDEPLRLRIGASIERRASTFLARR